MIVSHLGAGYAFVYGVEIALLATTLWVLYRGLGVRSESRLGRTGSQIGDMG
jgi:hypothetical protein